MIRTAVNIGVNRNRDYKTGKGVFTLRSLFVRVRSLHWQTTPFFGQPTPASLFKLLRMRAGRAGNRLRGTKLVRARRLKKSFFFSSPGLEVTQVQQERKGSYR